MQKQEKKRKKRSVQTLLNNNKTFMIVKEKKKDEIVSAFLLGYSVPIPAFLKQKYPADNIIPTCIRHAFFPLRTILQHWIVPSYPTL